MAPTGLAVGRRGGCGGSSPAPTGGIDLSAGRDNGMGGRGKGNGDAMGDVIGTILAGGDAIDEGRWLTGENNGGGKPLRAGGRRDDERVGGGRIEGVRVGGG